MDELRTPGGVRVDPAGLRFVFARGGGPGGQHVNTSATKATVVLDVGTALRGRARQLVRERYGETMRATSSAQRSQWQNRNAALERLLVRIDAAVARPEPRVETRVPPREKRRRREDKARRSQRLQQRRVPPE